MTNHPTHRRTLNKPDHEHLIERLKVLYDHHRSKPALNHTRRLT